MNLKLGLVLLAVASLLVPTRTTADDPKAKGVDRFVGTYVNLRVPPGEGRRRLVITKDGDYYRLEDKLADPKKDLYRHFRFVRKSAGQLIDEKEILGTITFGQMTFEDGKSSPIPILRVRFCYEHFLLIHEGGPGAAW